MDLTFKLEQRRGVWVVIHASGVECYAPSDLVALWNAYQGMKARAESAERRKK